ncbi:MAG: hypothetical protein QNK37_11535 [Acidobacteriota bacterium]|nr:hypothetical protein [Acidobacteriota bacterium]
MLEITQEQWRRIAKTPFGKGYLRSIPIEERLEGIPPEKRLAGLSKEEIQALLERYNKDEEGRS